MGSYLFVYGSLRQQAVDKLGFYAEFARYTDYLARGSLQGRLYEVDGYPGAVLSENSVDKVRGEVYRIKNQAQLFALLDDYEECSSNFPEPHEYVREQVPIICAHNAGVLTAWTYLYSRNVGRLTFIASGDYCLGCT